MKATKEGVSQYLANQEKNGAQAERHPPETLRITKLRALRCFDTLINFRKKYEFDKFN